MAESPPDAAKKVLFYCRDVESHLKFLGEAEVNAELRGLITKVRDMGKIIFFDLRDATGLVQLLGNRRNIPEEEWESVQKIKPGMRVWVAGSIGRTKAGQATVFLNRAPQLKDLTFESSVGSATPEYAQVGNQMFVARLRNRAAEFWREQGYLEIEPKYISTRWSSQGVEPLQIVYPGFGASAYLAPTPATQLLEALVVTGADAVFATGRLFSTTFRDEKSSAESLIVSARTIGPSHPQHLQLAKQCVEFTFGNLETFPEAGLAGLNEWREVQLTGERDNSRSQTVIVPTLEIYEMPTFVRAESQGKILTLFRLVWPPSRTIAEGATEQIGDDLILASTTVHIERMASLLRDLPVRQIRNLGIRNDEK